MTWRPFSGDESDAEVPLYVPLVSRTADGIEVPCWRGFTGHMHYRDVPNETQINPQPTHWRMP